MSNAASQVWKLASFLLVLVAPLLAQNEWQSQRIPSATAPVFTVGLGYTLLSMSVPGAGRANVNGVDASAGIQFSSRWGAMVDSTYARASNVVGTPHSAYLLSFLGGPVFYPIERRNTRLFLRGLAGAGLVDGVAPKSNTDYRRGWVFGRAYAIGAGVEHGVAGPLGLRLGGDYLRTAFFDYAGVLQPQDNFRFTVGMVFPYRKRAAQ